MCIISFFEFFIKNISDNSNPFQTAVSFWLYNGFQFTADNRLISNPKFKTFDPLIGELKTPNAIEKKLGKFIEYHIPFINKGKVEIPRGASFLKTNYCLKAHNVHYKKAFGLFKVLLRNAFIHFTIYDLMNVMTGEF